MDHTYRNFQLSNGTFAVSSFLRCGQRFSNWIHSICIVHVVQKFEEAGSIRKRTNKQIHQFEDFGVILQITCICVSDEFLREFGSLEFVLQ